MSAVREGRYSLDYDPEFEEMLVKLKTSKLHSSLIEEQPRALDGAGITQKPAPLVWSPSFAPMELSQEETPPPINEAKKRPASRRNSAQQQSIKVGNIVLGIDDEKSNTDESSDSGSEVLIDLNSTYSSKTMGNRRLSHMLDILKEIETEEEQTVCDSEKKANSKESSRQLNYRHLPLPDYLSPFTPSPHTPRNKVNLVPDRSYRLGNVSNFVQTPRSKKTEKRPHESTINKREFARCEQ